MADALMVVVAEDEFLIRIAAADALEEIGLAVAEVSNADQALQRIAEAPERVRVLFSDIHMPGSMTGLELATKVHETWPWIRMLLASGKAEPGVADIPPGTVFVSKPYDLEKLVRHVRVMMDEAE